MNKVKGNGFGYFLDPCMNKVKGDGFGYFLDPSIYVVTLNEIVGRRVICPRVESCLLASLVDNNNLTEDFDF